MEQSFTHTSDFCGRKTGCSVGTYSDSFPNDYQHRNSPYQNDNTYEDSRNAIAFGYDNTNTNPNPKTTIFGLFNGKPTTENHWMGHYHHLLPWAGYRCFPRIHSKIINLYRKILSHPNAIDRCMNLRNLFTVAIFIHFQHRMGMRK